MKKCNCGDFASTVCVKEVVVEEKKEGCVCLCLKGSGEERKEIRYSC
jgi:hypothetical protein